MTNCKRCGERPATICVTCQGDLAEHYEQTIKNLSDHVRNLLIAIDEIEKQDNKLWFEIPTVETAVERARAALARCGGGGEEVG